jgi:hypothetical protein
MKPKLDKKSLVTVQELRDQLQDVHIQFLQLRDTANTRFAKAAGAFTDICESVNEQISNIHTIESRLNLIAPKKKKFWFFKRK